MPKHEITVEMSVLLGQKKMPVQRLLKLGRGAIIELDTNADDDLIIYANDTPVAQGQIVVTDGVVGIEVTKLGITGSSVDGEVSLEEAALAASAQRQEGVGSENADEVFGQDKVDDTEDDKNQ